MERVSERLREKMLSADDQNSEAELPKYQHYRQENPSFSEQLFREMIIFNAN